MIEPKTFNKNAKLDFDLLVELCAEHEVDPHKGFDKKLETKVKEFFFFNCYLQDRMKELHVYEASGGSIEI